jgi:hypothetical protein
LSFVGYSGFLSYCGALSLLRDLNFVAHAAQAVPGDGSLIIGYIVIGLLVSVPVSILLAVIMLSISAQNQIHG